MKTITIAFWVLVVITSQIFLILKLTNNISWSWWWVTSPLWIAIIVSVFAFIGIRVLAWYAYMQGG